MLHRLDQALLLQVTLLQNFHFNRSLFLDHYEGICNILQGWVLEMTICGIVVVDEMLKTIRQ